MPHTYWYKIRTNNKPDALSIMGWQTTYDSEQVVKTLSRLYGSRLAYVYQDLPDGTQVSLYSNM
jgi:hypothetical protein